MLLQANDYLWLHDHLGCELQMGGSDQWGNIVSGVDLIRRKRQVAVHALAWPLLMAADGTKLGKTTGARLWLDPAKTSPYQFHQHWMQLDDQELEQQFMFFSLRPLAGDRRRCSPSTPRPRSGASPSGRSPTRSPRSSTATAAARAAGEAADVLFGGDPLGASPGGAGDAGRRGAVEPGRRRPRSTTSWSCWSRPGWPRRRATPAASCSRAACGPTACVVGPDQGLRRRCAAARPLPAAAQGKAVATTWSRFLRPKVDGPARRR